MKIYIILLMDGSMFPIRNRKAVAKGFFQEGARFFEVDENVSLMETLTKIKSLRRWMYEGSTVYTGAKRGF